MSSFRIVERFYYLSRFRADPTKVRIGIAHRGESWMVTIESRSDKSLLPVVAFSSSPHKALVKAYRMADELKFPGVDPSMKFAYRHPHGPMGPRVTKHVELGCIFNNQK